MISFCRIFCAYYYTQVLRFFYQQSKDRASVTLWHPVLFLSLPLDLWTTNLLCGRSLQCSPLKSRTNAFGSRHRVDVDALPILWDQKPHLEECDSRKIFLSPVRWDKMCCTIGVMCWLPSNPRQHLDLDDQLERVGWIHNNRAEFIVFVEQKHRWLGIGRKIFPIFRQALEAPWGGIPIPGVLVASHLCSPKKNHLG